MIAVLLSEVVGAVVFAADDSGPVWLLALGPAGGGALYFGLWRYYRNTHQSHSFERETRIQARPITGNDRKVDEIKGTKKTSIDGDNKTNHRQRVQRVQ